MLYYDMLYEIMSCITLLPSLLHVWVFLHTDYHIYPGRLTGRACHGGGQHALRLAVSIRTCSWEICGGRVYSKGSGTPVEIIISAL